MHHLTFEEMTDFVSMTELNAESMTLASKVNGHISRCSKCLELVRAYQCIYDEFRALHIRGRFADFVSVHSDITIQDLFAADATRGMDKQDDGQRVFDRGAMKINL